MTEISFGLLFSAVVVCAVALVGVGMLDVVGPHPPRGQNLMPGSNTVPCWIYPNHYETNADHIISVFSVGTTNYEGAIIFGKHPGAGVWVEEGVRYGGLRTQYVGIAIFRDLKLLLIPPDKTEWKVRP